MKFKKVLLSILTCLTLFSCSPKVKDPILIDSELGRSEAINLTKDELKEKVSHKDEAGNQVVGDSFILYIYTVGCSDCAYFENNVLNKYIEETSAVIYKVNTTLIDGIITTPSTYKYNPRICIFKDGKVYTQTTKYNSEKVFEELNEFKDYLGKYVKVKDMKKVNYEQLKQIINSNEHCVIYYQLSSCRDCAFLEENFLNSYLVSANSIKNFYVFDVKEFRQYKTPTNDGENEEIYNSFIAEVSLDINGNRGVYPTFIEYYNSNRISYDIYFNDKLEYNEKDKSYKVVSSIYDNNPVLNQKFESYEKYQESSKTFYNNKLQSYLDDIMKGV